MRNFSTQELLDSLKADLDWELSYSIDLKLRRESYRRAFVSCFYPRTLASFTLFNGILHHPIVTQRKYTHNLLNCDDVKSLTYRWTTKRVEKVRTMFPDKFEVRSFKDGIGRVNFNSSNGGPITGGQIVPLIDRHNVFVMTYDYCKQKLKFNFMFEKQKCVPSKKHGSKFTNLLV